MQVVQGAAATLTCLLRSLAMFDLGKVSTQIARTGHAAIPHGHAVRRKTVSAGFCGRGSRHFFCSPTRRVDTFLVSDTRPPLRVRSSRSRTGRRRRTGVIRRLHHSADAASGHRLSKSECESAIIRRPPPEGEVSLPSRTLDFDPLLSGSIGNARCDAAARTTSAGACRRRLSPGVAIGS